MSSTGDPNGSSVTTILGGLPGPSIASPVSGTGVFPIGSAGNPIPISGGASAFAQPIVENGVVTGISGSFTTSAALTLVSTTVAPTVQLYVAPPSNNDYVPVAGAKCEMGPLGGIVSTGQVVTCKVEGLSVPVAGGSHVILVYSATAEGVQLVNTLTGYWAASLTLQ